MTSFQALSITNQFLCQRKLNSSNLLKLKCRSGNISRTIEGCTSTNSRHFIASSMDPIEDWLKDKNYYSLLKFVLETILNILREKLMTIKQTKPLAKVSSDVVVVELCAIHQLISFPDFSQVCQVINMFELATEPKLKTTKTMVHC